jgi:hypothetical protein
LVTSKPKEMWEKFLGTPEPAFPIRMAIKISVLSGGICVSFTIFGLYSAVLPKNIVFRELGKDEVCPFGSSVAFLSK